MAVMESKVGDWAKMELRIQQNMARAPTIVTLDVGGTIFKTSKDTLVRVKGSYFHVLLGSGLWPPDSGGDAYFLDLDPTLFRCALMFMRTGTTMSTDGLTTIERHEFHAMMEYLNEAPTQLFEWDPNTHAKEMALSNANRTVERMSLNNGYFKAAVANAALVDRIRVRVDVCSGSFGVGVGPAAGFDVSTSKSTTLCYRYWSHGEVFKKGPEAIVTLAKIQAGDVVTIRLAPSHVEFALNDGPPVNLALEDPTEESLSLSYTLKQSHSRLTALLHAVDRPADDSLGADQEEFIRLLSDEASPTSSLHHEVLQCISVLFARAKRDFSRDTFHLPPGHFTFQSFSTGCSYLYTHAASVNAAPLTSPMVMEVRRIVHTLLGFQPCFRTTDGTMNLHVLVTAWKNTTKLCKTFSAHIAIPENAPAIANLIGYVQTSSLDTMRFLDGCLSTALPLDSTAITHNIQPLDPACRQHWTSLVDDVSNCIQASLSLGDPTTERGLKTFETGLLGSIQLTHPSDQVLHLLAAYARYCVERTPSGEWDDCRHVAAWEGILAAQLASTGLQYQLSTVVERICADGPSHAFDRVDQAKLCLLERFSRSLLDGVDDAYRVVYTEKFMRMCYECCGTAVQIIEQASDDGLWWIVDVTLLVLGGIFSSHAVDDSTDDDDVQACIAETMPMLLQVLDQLATLTCPPGYECDDMRINMYANEKVYSPKAISVVLSDSSLPLQANGICQDLHEAASVLLEYIDIKYNKETTAADPAKLRKRTQSQLDRLGDACARVKRACSMHPRLLDDHKIHVALDNVTGLLDNLVQTLEMSDR
ncbi:hypothetical protein DYB36_003892 [Aphanomyces astaci]|uniref:BTB domain-containing protein n=1 Tax=Aphanomyces astaci TaxID=112090 RepID=A0A397AN91_APHAT|nr:hypothetical protein DYB36_003892 [Aphanomyces astaci]